LRENGKDLNYGIWDQAILDKCIGQKYDITSKIRYRYIGIGIGIGLLKIHIAASKAELHEITV